MKKLSFDSLPEELSKLTEKVTRIEELLLNQQSDSKSQDLLNERPLCLKEAANFLDISASSLYSKISKREIPHMKRGAKGRVYFFRSQILQYLSDSSVKSKSEIQAEARDFNQNRKKNIS